MPKPDDRPEPHWKSIEDWYEFFDFACPSCKKAYVADNGSDVPPRYRPKPLAVHARWNPTAAPVQFEADIICDCMVKFEVKG